MDLIAGVDLGTSSCKVTVIREDGEQFQASSAPYGIDEPRSGWAEQNPRDWEPVVHSTLDNALKAAGVQRSDSVVLAYTGQMHSLVALDSSGQPLRPAILWCDRRSSEQAAFIEELMPDFATRTGNHALPAFTLPQLMWIRENEPLTYAEISRVCVPKDYLRFRSTGIMGTDWTDASGMAMLNARTREWDPEITERFGIDTEVLPRVVAPDERCGSFTTSSGITVETVAGVADQVAEALSAGVLDPGEVCISLGTSAVLLGASAEAMLGAFCHAPEDRWLRLESLHAGGKSLTWFRETFMPGSSLGEILSLAGTSPAGSRGLIYLPFLLGDRQLRGAGAPAGFLGAREGHTLADYARAVLEGVAMELRRMSEKRDLQDQPTRITIKGGGGSSPLWSEIVGEVFRTPYAGTTRDAAFGTALVAGRAQGWAADYRAPWPEATSTREPDPKASETMADVYRSYTETVSALIAVGETPIGRNEEA